MGYRQYFYEVDKNIIDGIQNCKTEVDLHSFCVENNLHCEKYEDGDTVEYYMPLYKLGKEVFEFGKYYENSGAMYKCGAELFSSEELRKTYEDYAPIICGKDSVRCAIEWQKEHIINIYEDLLKEKSDDVFDERSQSERIIQHCKSHLRWWKPQFGDYTAYDLSNEKENLVSSWLYEHTIFDLVRIYKTFDFTSKSLLFMGW